MTEDEIKQKATEFLLKKFGTSKSQARFDWQKNLLVEWYVEAITADGDAISRETDESTS